MWLGDRCKKTLRERGREREWEKDRERDTETEREREAGAKKHVCLIQIIGVVEGS